MKREDWEGPPPPEELKAIHDPDLAGIIARNKERHFMSLNKRAARPEYVHSRASFGDKAWMGVKHFLYGFVVAGFTAFQTTGNLGTALVAGAVGGVAGATRKIVKESRKDKGKDWSDFLDRALELAILLVKTWRERRQK